MISNSDKDALSEIISSTQSEISSVCENMYYKEAYMQEEMSYWDNISKWLYEDRNRRKIQRCLDIGCGYGTLLLVAKKIYGCSIYGMDYMESFMSNKIIDKYNIDFKVCNVETDSIPWEHNFDMILLTEVIEHFNFNVIVTLRKIREKLSDDGVLYLSTPDAQWHGKVTKYYKSYKDMPAPKRNIPIKDCHVYVFSKSELLKIFNNVGLKVKEFGITDLYHFNFKLKKI